MVALTINCVVLVAVSARFGLSEGRSSGYMILVIPTVAGYFLAWSAIGSWLGKSMSRKLALPLAALLPYVFYAVISSYSNSPITALALDDSRLYAYVRPTETLVVSQAVFWLVAASALFSALAAPMTLRRMTVWATSLSAALLLYQGAAFELIPGATAPVCTEGTPNLCLERSFLSVMPRYRDAVEQLESSIPAPIRPGTVGSLPSVTGGQQEPVLLVPPVDGFTEPSRLIDETMFAARMGDALFLQPCIGVSEPSSSAYALVLWWRYGHHIPVDGTVYPGDTDYPANDPEFRAHRTEAMSFADMSPNEREEWFEKNGPLVKTCMAPPL